MATDLHSESRRLYSWWWDSHISPKSSRWLQENLTDMDAKVKAMIKLIEEDADSFARRAEMYYKKRPELMKLVEEFYRAYRALAERYDYATVELRQAHRTMAEAFPNQVPFMLSECSPSGSSPPGTEPQTPEMPHSIRALLDPDELHKDALSPSDFHSFKRNGNTTDESESGSSKKGLKRQSFMFGSRDGFSQNQNLVTDSDHERKAESVVQTLREALAELKAEKEALFLQYQQTLERLAVLDRELNHAQTDASALDQRACKAETEVDTLREALSTTEAERDGALHQHKLCLEKISNLESSMTSLTIKAETEAQNLKLELLHLKAEKEHGLHQYKRCVEEVRALADKISNAEEDAQKLIEQTIRAETEVQILKQALAESTEEKEAIAVQYKQCLEILSKVESELSCANEDVKRLDSKLKSAEEQCTELGRSNHSLQLEVSTVAKKMIMKDQELLQKNEELEKLQVCVQNEHSRLLEVEATLQTLQNMHSQSQEEHRALVWEVKNGLQLLKDSEKCKQELEREIQRINKENQSLNDLNLSSNVLVKDMQNETFNLRKTKGKLEVKVAEQLDQIKALQRDIFQLKEEIKGLNRRYQALLEQLESVGLNPDTVASSVKALQEENSKLKDSYNQNTDEKEALLEKLENMEILLEKNAALESSLLDVTGELEVGKEKVKLLEESYQSLLGEKSMLNAEKSALFSQIQIITGNMQNLLEGNAKLQLSFSAVNAEVENLREKSKSLDESCRLLRIEKSNLLTERETLISQLETVEKRLENLEQRFTLLEDRHSGMEKEKEYALQQVEELQFSLDVEKEERATFMLLSESRLVGLENHVHLLQEESRRRQKEFEGELEKAVNAQVEIFILQKCVSDMEQNNFSLLMECDKHNKASKLSEKMISELERENLEQQVELEFLLDEVQTLKKGIYKIFMALQADQDDGHVKEAELEKVALPEINRNIKDMKGSLVAMEEEKQKLLVENSVLFALIEELRIQGIHLESGHKTVKEGLLQELRDLQEKYLGLQNGNSKAAEEYTFLSKNFFELKEEKCLLEEENIDVLEQAISFSNLSLIYSCFGAEKVAEVKAIANDIGDLRRINSDLKKEVECLREVNGDLELEKDTLHGEIDERRIREENLIAELKEKSDDFEIWEAEAAKFYFDLQVSIVRDHLYENKVLELTNACEGLEDRNASKTVELEQMKETVSSLECELGKFKAQLSAYDPAIDSLKDDLASLERNAILPTKHSLDDDQKQKDEELMVDFHERQTTTVATGISDLQNMQTRIKAIEKVIQEEKESSTNARQDTAVEEGKTSSDETRGDLDLMKDIPLDRFSSRSFHGTEKGENGRTDDQMLELWETSDHGFGLDPSALEAQMQASAIMDNTIGNAASELQLEKELSVDKVEVSTGVTSSHQETANRSILDRLTSDSQKLQSLQTTVQDLKRKMEANKKNKKGKAATYETVEEQLQETEETVMELTQINAELAAEVEESRPSSSDGEEEDTERKSISEKAQKGSEKISRLQLEVQKMQYLLLKLNDEKTRTSKSSVLFRGFSYSGGRKKKGCFCGCLRASSREGDQGKLI